jgi:hypothetical protein
MGEGRAMIIDGYQIDEAQVLDFDLVSGQTFTVGDLIYAVQCAAQPAPRSLKDSRCDCETPEFLDGWLRCGRCNKFLR